MDMHLGSILNLIYFVGAIGGLFVLIGFFTLCWMLIVQIIKFHERKMRAIAQAKEANQFNVPLVNSQV
jgi:protein-S-isoprenylcysteine O-methyltransferase Ste14